MKVRCRAWGGPHQKTLLFFFGLCVYQACMNANIPLRHGLVAGPGHAPRDKQAYSPNDSGSHQPDGKDDMFGMWRTANITDLPPRGQPAAAAVTFNSHRTATTSGGHSGIGRHQRCVAEASVEAGRRQGPRDRRGVIGGDTFVVRCGADPAEPRRMALLRGFCKSRRWSESSTSWWAPACLRNHGQ